MSHGAQGESSGVFNRFIHSEVSGSIVLLFCTITALIWANSPWADLYTSLSQTRIGVSWGESAFSMSLQHWINDGLMAVFFFVVGLEIKRELVVGHLSSVKQAILPVSAAIGGMLVPAAFYLIFNAGGEGARGWGVPMATDIAFALGILSLFGSRVPIGLKVFLTALAIADDLGAVMVIALFYTEQIFVWGLFAAAVFLFLLHCMVMLDIDRPGIYWILIIGAWASVFSSGIHATVAGILVALLVPIRARIEPDEFIEIVDTRMTVLRNSSLTQESMLCNEEQMDTISDLCKAVEDIRPEGLHLEEFLHPVVAFFILPLFALFNAGVELDGRILDTLSKPVSIGIIAGLFLGKQLGVWFFSWLAVRTGRVSLPEGVTWPQVYGVGCLAGVGFTMSLFISDLAFIQETNINEAKIGILVASLLSGVVGYIVLRKSLPPGE